MAHSVTHTSYALAKRAVIGRYVRCTEKNGCAPDGSYYGFGQSLTIGSHYSGRDASHHTVVDSYGWRVPTPYWGYRFDTGRFTPVGGTTNATIPYRSSPTDYYKYGNNYPIMASAALPMTVTQLKSYRPYFGNLQSAAITSALAELGSATAELGVELREAQKTAEFIGDKLEEIAYCARTLRAGKVPHSWKKKWRALKHHGETPVGFAKTWLEYRYAWTPMVLGVHDALSLLEKRKERPFLYTVRKRVEAESGGSWSNPIDTNHGGYYPFKCNQSIRKVTTDSVYVVMTFTPKEAFFVSLNDAGVLDPASVTWETVPLSFVVDWFVGVGDYLQAQQALRLFRLYGGTATHVREWKSEVKVDFKLGPNQYWCTAPTGGIASAGGFAFNRVVLNTVDHLTPRIVAGNGLNFVRSLDALALIYGALTGKRPRGLRT